MLEKRNASNFSKKFFRKRNEYFHLLNHSLNSLAHAKISLGGLFLFILISNYLVFGVMDQMKISSSLFNQVADALVFLFIAALIVKGRKIPRDGILFVLVLFFAWSLISFIVNMTDPVKAVKMWRQYFIPGLFYLALLWCKFSKQFYEKVLKFLFVVGYMQAPIVIAQKVLYPYIPYKLKADIQPVDYVSGTVGAVASGILASFLVLLIIIKFQESLTYGFSKERIMQLLVLLIPIGIVQSDAQFLFLPFLLVFQIIINYTERKQKKRIVVGFAIVILAVLLLNFVLGLATFNERNVFSYTTMYFSDNYWKKTVFGVAEVQAGIGSANRITEMLFFLKQPVSFFGDGPGSWYMTQVEKEKKPLKRVMMLNATVLVNYAELGLLGVSIIMLIPIYTYFSSKNEYWGRIIKAQSVYIFMLLFYHWPFYRFVIIMPYFISWIYYKKFIRGKDQSALEWRSS